MIGLLFFLVALFFYQDVNKRYISILLLFVTATAGFQLIPVNLMILSGFGVSKPYDWVLLFCGVMFLFFPKMFFNRFVWKEYKNLTIFGIVLLLLLFYSIYFRGVEVPISIRVFRNFIFFLPIFLFVNLNLSDFVKIFRLVTYATTIASALYCLQLVVGKPILNTVGSDMVTINDATGLTRFYNLPVFICPVVFFFFFKGNLLSLKFYRLQMVINYLAIILSQHRNLALAIVCCYLLRLFLSKKLKPVKLVAYIGIAVVAYNVADNLLDKRFSSGVKDLSEASVSVTPETINALDIYNLSTTEFRYYLVVERLQYILLKPATTLFGIGFLTEDSRLTQALRFNIGMPDDSGNVFQVDTGDIIWSVMVLQFGLLGILFFIFYYIYFLKRFYVFRDDLLTQCGILYVVILFITSFYGTSILDPYTTCMVVLFAAYTYVLKQSSHWSITLNENKTI